MHPPEAAVVHESRVRVRYAETDRMGVAYYANYLIWFEVARTDFLRESGLRYRDLEAQGVLLPVSDVAIRFTGSARYDDELRVECWMAEVRSRRITFGYRILRDEDVLAHGTTTLHSVDSDMKPQRLPEEALAKMQELSGES